MAADSPEELGSANDRMPMEGSGMANVATDAPCSASKGSRDDAWANYVSPAQANASSLVHCKKSMDKAKALHKALENAENHVSTMAKPLMALMNHKDSVVYVCVASCVHTLQCH